MDRWINETNEGLHWKKRANARSHQDRKYGLCLSAWDLVEARPLSPYRQTVHALLRASESGEAAQLVEALDFGSALRETAAGGAGNTKKLAGEIASLLSQAV